MTALDTSDPKKSTTTCTGWETQFAAPEWKIRFYWTATRKERLAGWRDSRYLKYEVLIDSVQCNLADRDCASPAAKPPQDWWHCQQEQS